MLFFSDFKKLFSLCNEFRFRMTQLKATDKRLFIWGHNNSGNIENHRDKKKRPHNLNILLKKEASMNNAANAEHLQVDLNFANHGDLIKSST